MPARRFLFGGWGRRRSISARDSSPCPGGNGTTIGSFQQFTTLCGSDVVGDIIDSSDAADFTACVDLCASHHPKCEAVSFNGKRCSLRANLVPERTHPSRREDAAVAQFGQATSNCPSLGGSQAAQGKNFGTFCGFIINGNDITQNFAPTFQDCMGQCAATTGCGAITFDASQDQGFKNCYLKTPTNSSDNIADPRVDTAILNAAAAPDPNPAPAPAPAPTPATTIVSTTAIVPVTTIVPAPAPPPVSSSSSSAAGVGAGASFFTPPSVPSSATSPSVAAPVISTQTVVSIVTSGSQTTAVTQILTTSVPAQTGFTFGTNTAPAVSSPSMSATAEDQPEPEADGSRAWIAAPVVGSAAAVVLIVLMFVMLGRRRSAANGSRGSGTSSGSRRRTGGGSSSSPGLFTTWLPGSPGRSKTKMGNFSEVTGQKIPSRNSMRGSVIGIWRPGAEKLDDIEEGVSTEAERKNTPVYEIKGGKAELRESMNGLGLNKWPASMASSS